MEQSKNEKFKELRKKLREIDNKIEKSTSEDEREFFEKKRDNLITPAKRFYNIVEAKGVAANNAYYGYTYIPGIKEEDVGTIFVLYPLEGEE